MAKRRPYEELRAGIEKLGGTMEFDKSRCQFGAWVVTLGDRQGVFASHGRRHFPELDSLYTPDPTKKLHKTWDDYIQPPIDGAIEKLVVRLK
jgi:hypothetical protein